MNAQYWNDFAHAYDDTVTDAFTYGRSNTLANIINRYSSKDLDAADFGCGPGKILPHLAARFRTVYAYDFSARLLNIARQRCTGLKNVKIRKADLSGPVGRLTQVEVIISLNAAIMPDTDLRLSFLHGMASRLRPGGHLLLDLPSIESLLYGTFREIEWHRREGSASQKAERMADVSCLPRPRMLARGVFYRGGEPTKHYLREELIVLVRDELGLDLIDILKMEYDWATEMEHNRIPAWMGDPHPWDWLVIAKARNQGEE